MWPRLAFRTPESGMPIKRYGWPFRWRLYSPESRADDFELWFRYRGARAIVCPENCEPAGVSVDAGHAALTAFAGRPDLRLSSCSRWPERAGCGQQCLSQIEASPDGCLVRKMLARWYEGKSCASCGRPFGEIEWTVQKPALISCR